jgi:hypothetical protein
MYEMAYADNRKIRYTHTRDGANPYCVVHWYVFSTLYW